MYINRVKELKTAAVKEDENSTVFYDGLLNELQMDFNYSEGKDVPLYNQAGN